MSTTETVRRMFEAYLAGDAVTASSLLADGVFVLYEYELKEGGRHRNTEHIVVRDGQLQETHVFFGGRYDG